MKILNLFIFTLVLGVVNCGFSMANLWARRRPGRMAPTQPLLVGFIGGWGGISLLVSFLNYTFRGNAPKKAV
jgi:hypothetical protein